MARDGRTDMKELSQAPLPIIRAAQPSDEAAIMDICLRTSYGGQDGSQRYSKPSLPGLLWALPYVRLYPQYAFVLSSASKVVGYCVAAPDTAAYEKRLETEWWQEVRTSLDGFTPATAEDEGVLAYVRTTPKTPKALTDLYPSHLHINLLPELQKGGFGSQLLHHQLGVLRASGSQGVHLGVDPRNERVTAFYAKFGFVELGRNPSIILGMRLERGST